MSLLSARDFNSVLQTISNHIQQKPICAMVKKVKRMLSFSHIHDNNILTNQINNLPWQLYIQRQLRPIQANTSFIVKLYDKSKNINTGRMHIYKNSAHKKCCAQESSPCTNVKYKSFIFQMPGIDDAHINLGPSSILVTDILCVFHPCLCYLT